MPETALMRQDCAEGACGGAGKGCYGKYSYFVRTKEIGEIHSDAPIYEEILKYEELDSS